jgi:hypothetical protein
MGSVNSALSLVLRFLGFLGCPEAGNQVDIFFWFPDLYGLRLGISF